MNDFAQDFETILNQFNESIEPVAGNARDK